MLDDKYRSSYTYKYTLIYKWYNWDKDLFLKRNKCILLGFLFKANTFVIMLNVYGKK